jgi:hypothetical protein
MVVDRFEKQAFPLSYHVFGSPIACEMNERNCSIDLPVCLSRLQYLFTLARSTVQVAY